MRIPFQGLQHRKGFGIKFSIQKNRAVLCNGQPDGLQLAQQWLKLDSDTESRKFVEDLVAKGAVDELTTLLEGRLEFGATRCFMLYCV